MIDPLDYYQKIQASASQDLVQLFGSNPVNINTPLEGSITSETEIQMMCIRFNRLADDYSATLSLLNSYVNNDYLVAELLLQGEEFELPIATVFQFEMDEEEEVTDNLLSIREYHSTYPLYQSHRIRDPILPPADPGELEEPEVVEAYMEALAAGEADTIIQLFTNNAYFREPSGSSYKVEGRDALSNLYHTILSQGGINLTHCTAIPDEDETTVAIEFIATKWGSTQLKPQAGIACYDYQGSKLTAARVYDDVNPPEFE